MVGCVKEEAKPEFHEVGSTWKWRDTSLTAEPSDWLTSRATSQPPSQNASNYHSTQLLHLCTLRIAATRLFLSTSTSTFKTNSKHTVHFHLQEKIHCDASSLSSIYLKPCQWCSILKLLFRGGSVLQLTCWECSNLLASKRRSEARPRVQLCFSSFSTSRTCPKDATAP